MRLFRREKRKTAEIAYDREQEEPVIRCSICTGEMTAGFRSRATGKFRSLMLLRDEEEAEKFREACGVAEVRKIY